MGARGAVLVPSFEPLPALFLADPDHALAADAFLARWEGARAHAALWDFGTAGRSAPDVAGALQEAGCDEVFALGGKHDRAAALRLEAALAARGIRAVIARGDGAPARFDAWLARAPVAAHAPRVLFRNSPLPARGASSSHAPQFVHAADVAAHGLRRSSADGIVAIALSPRAALPPPREVADRLVCDSAGREAHWRLWIEDRYEPLVETAADSDWGARHGFADMRLADFVSALLEDCAPALADAYGIARSWWENGVDVLAEMYAGTALADRNQDLLRNVIA